MRQAEARLRQAIANCPDSYRRITIAVVAILVVAVGLSVLSGDSFWSALAVVLVILAALGFFVVAICVSGGICLILMLVVASAGLFILACVQWLSEVIMERIRPGYVNH